MKSFHIELSDVDLFNEDTEQQLEDFKAAVDIDHDGFISEVGSTESTGGMASILHSVLVG